MRRALYLLLPSLVDILHMSSAFVAPAEPLVLGCGVVCVDYIAQCSNYPAPDAKVKCDRMDILGGGNSGNTLIACSRMGLKTAIISKVGTDSNGQFILDGLKDESVDTSRVVVSPRTQSSFTYVIVDKAELTRTCIHTPMSEELEPSEIDPSHLDGVSLLHLDGRHTQAAVALAKLARARGIPICLDAEKDRPYFRELLPLCDYIVTNSAYPILPTGGGGSTTLEGMQNLLALGPKLVVTTLGADGSMLMCKSEEDMWEGFCDVEANTETASGPFRLKSETFGSEGHRVLRCSAYPIETSEIVDTTGAGDAFIGGVIYGIINKLPASKLLAVASYVAAKKLRAPGAREGIPYLDEVKSALPHCLT